MPKKRSLFFFKDYFHDFYRAQTDKVKNKILWTLRVVEDLDQIPEIYFKHITGSDDLYEIRVQVGSDTFRIFCFFDKSNVVVIGHGFAKKSQKTPKSELDRAHNIKAAYHESQ